MIVIVDNGSGAEEISQFLKTKNKIVSPKAALKEKKVDGYILSDGDPKHIGANIDILEKSKVPVMGIGAGGLFIGSLFEAEITKTKPAKTEKLSLKKASPLTLDLKKTFTVAKACSFGFSSVPENFKIIASSAKYEYEILQEESNPFFIIGFNPELGMEGRQILTNFEKFVNIWDEHH